MDEMMIDTPNGSFAVRSAGADDAPVVLMLHGFPDDASTFDDLGHALAAEGYRAVAPYLRGYAPSPLDGPLTLDALIADLLALADALSPNHPVYFVGHDYGAQIGYLATTRAPERFGAAVMLAGAHPAAINRRMKRLPRQWWMSRYIIFFQFGGVADRAVARDDFAYVERLWRRWSPGFIPPPAHLARVKATLRRSMPAPVAMYREGGFDVPADPIAVPTLFITGEKDGCLLPQLSNGQDAIFTNGYKRELWSDVGHFPHLEQPSRSAKAIVAWFAEFGPDV
jgi:pimeloyl-ACP methyl ester carboxylesterase